MTPAAFRRDRWLRTSASHLATWSIAALVIDAVLRSHTASGESTRTAMLVVIAGGSLLNSMTTERRIAKMIGVAGEPVYAAAGTMWRCVLAVLALASIALVGAQRPDAVIPMWLAGVGSAFVFWGRKAEFRWYAGVGAAMIAAAIVDGSLVVSSGPSGPLRVVVLVLALPVVTIATNRRFLWVRSEG